MKAQAAASLMDADLLIAFTLPVYHYLASAPFADYPKDGTSVERGMTTVEVIDENIHRVSFDRLVSDVLDKDGWKLTWQAKRQSHGRMRIYLKFSPTDEAIAVSDEMCDPIDKLLAKTWIWGRIRKLCNTKARDCVYIEVVDMDNSAPDHIFALGDDGAIAAYEVAN